jgi:hypothetical protein
VTLKEVAVRARFAGILAGCARWAQVLWGSGPVGLLVTLGGCRCWELPRVPCGGSGSGQDRRWLCKLISHEFVLVLQDGGHFRGG